MNLSLHWANSQTNAATPARLVVKYFVFVFWWGVCVSKFSERGVTADIHLQCKESSDSNIFCL